MLDSGPKGGGFKSKFVLWPALPYENFAFCDLIMPNFWTYFGLNV